MADRFPGLREALDRHNDWCVSGKDGTGCHCDRPSRLAALPDVESWLTDWLRSPETVRTVAENVYGPDPAGWAINNATEALIALTEPPEDQQ